MFLGITNQVTDPIGSIQQPQRSANLIVVAVGALIMLGSLFLILAAHQILPHGINSISNLGLACYFASYGPFTIGLVTFLIGVVRLTCSQKAINQKIEREVLNPQKNTINETKGDHQKIDDGSPMVAQIRGIAQKPINQTGEILVCFYKSGPTEFLGNFSLCSKGISLWGQHFRCAEAAFQWRKYNLSAQENGCNALLNDPKMQEFFSCDGEGAFQLHRHFSNAYKGIFVQEWNERPVNAYGQIVGVRDEVMWAVLNAKFQQNPELQQLLDATGTAYLLEHNDKSGKDNYWSDNHDGTGEK